MLKGIDMGIGAETKDTEQEGGRTKLLSEAGVAIKDKL